MTTAWPKSLEAWEPELRVFARDLIGQLASLSERIANAIGPLRVSTERRSSSTKSCSPAEARLMNSSWFSSCSAHSEMSSRS